MSENGIVWEEPPPRTRGGNGGKWLPVLAALMEHPKRWARIAEKATPDGAGSAAQAFRNGVSHPDRPQKITSPPGQWEFASRTVLDEDMEPHYYVYARFLGPEEESA